MSMFIVVPDPVDHERGDREGAVKACALEMYNLATRDYFFDWRIWSLCVNVVVTLRQCR